MDGYFNSPTQSWNNYHRIIEGEKIIKDIDDIFGEPRLIELNQIPPAYNDKLVWQMAELCRLAYIRFEYGEEASYKKYAWIR